MSPYTIAKLFVSVLAIGFLIAGIVSGILAGIRKKQIMILMTVLFIVLFFVDIFMFYVLSVRQYYPGVDSYGTFNATSSDLNGENWDVRIANDKGDNLSPELDWESVDGAVCYAVVMIDPDGSNWLHMKALTSGTHLSSGEAEEYVGPYPPAGIHEYDVYVIALKNEKTVPGTLNLPCDGVEEILSMLDTYNGDTGNVLGYAKVTGFYPQ